MTSRSACLPQAGGFIGVHLTKQCAEIGYTITAVDIYKDKFDTIISPEVQSNVKYVKCSASCLNNG